MKFKPHPYQLAAIDWIHSHPACGLFLDMGLGKTVTTLTVLKDLIYDLAVSKALVIAPKRVAEETWPAELGKWDHLQDLTYSLVAGSRKDRLAALDTGADIDIIGRDNLTWLVDHYGKDWPYEAIVIDELSSFKNHQSKRFKALRKVRPLSSRVIGLTGTPAPNSYIDLWAQLYLLDRGKRLGKTISIFRDTFCIGRRWPSMPVTLYEIRPGAEPEIDQQISDICISMAASDYLDLPDRAYIDLPVTLPDQAMRHYKAMAKDAVMALGGETITATNAAVLSGKLLQLANGFAYTEADAGQQILHDEKIKALEELIEAAQGEPVLVFYQFKSDLDRIQHRFEEAKTIDDDNIMARWNAGQVPLLLLHPQSAGHGLNLQQGGRIIVWFGLPWSLEYYQQANARLYRQGQEKPVRIYHIIAKDTIDERVLAALTGKDERQQALLDAVKAEVKALKSAED
ncbi:DEAD/DEAH box helicase [Peptococcus simiae]|uniref:DEAD/DEAH box helicase n=1 Tax=Peptococcus simiae TaxID=1643805 RepID=UPI003980EEF1